MLIRIDQKLGGMGAKISGKISRLFGGGSHSTICARLGKAHLYKEESCIQKSIRIIIDTIEKGHCKKAYRLYRLSLKKREEMKNV